MPGAYYNEIDPYAAEWLRNLIAAGHIAPGVVDTRSIEEVRPNELREFTQCHFFAGIGVWSYALRLAGWPDERPVWTGSCPCQPFSAAGKAGGFNDERHLWPAWRHLIGECLPRVVFGEQVASKDGLAWLDLVHTDMEAEGYAVGAFDLCAAGVGAPHIRQRFYFVAQSGGDRARNRVLERSGRELCGALGDTHSHPAGRNARGACGAQAKINGPDARDDNRLRDASPRPNNPGPTNGHWGAADWLYCRDGKWRPVEPGTFPLAHGAPSRVGRLRAYGNAIVPQVAAQFIESYLEVTETCQS
jgi:DNA (cytosine-5)-methyltransferase 1